MKKLPIGLVIEGNSTSSTLLRLAAVANELGPIKSAGLQVARRVSNFLKGGYSVATYSDLSKAKTILIRVPDSSIDRVVSDLCRCTNFVWAEHAFVLCETWTPTERLQPLKNLGSNIASLVALPAGSRKTFAIEGDVGLVRQIRRLIDKSDAKGIELRPATKHLLFAATALCSAIPLPLLLMAQQFLRDGGVSGNHLSAMIEEMTLEMLGSFLKGARMTWGGALAELLGSTQGAYWDQLDVTHPDLARSLRELVHLTQNYSTPRLSRVQGA